MVTWKRLTLSLNLDILFGLCSAYEATSQQRFRIAPGWFPPNWLFTVRISSRLTAQPGPFLDSRKVENHQECFEPKLWSISRDLIINSVHVFETARPKTSSALSEKFIHHEAPIISLLTSEAMRAAEECLTTIYSRCPHGRPCQSHPA